VSAVTGTPGAEDGGACASAFSATVPSKSGSAAAPKARASVRGIAAFLMKGDISKRADLYGTSIIDNSYI
jgi:hypothetical protein